ncbi:haloalkane dehalogenase [Flavobacterium sp. 7E]|uniref:alpha/beta fold hydrolase n=1 Tax=unclassified Flavobacterium TaxID=196869 RepID=UPI0015712A4C|nr:MULTISPECIES: alpha/beta fold hydrolase [unclassified Flavobacterium]MBE0392858.1 Haloalkane dehalogenase 2 [Flavobacterium sp. PL002]NRS90121.1 haloalkane dehalogenase [Flavobacterium sp. 7E]
MENKINTQIPDPVIFNRDRNNKKQRPFIVDKTEYPFQSNWFERDGVSMHYIEEGEGIPIVLTHGNPDWSFLNRNIIKELSGEARVIAYDLPGFGFSDTPANYGFTPQEHAQWISALLFEHLKLDKFIIVVQDWGGPTGLSVATSNPDKVLGVVISNTWAWKAEGKMVEFSMYMRTPEMQAKIIDENFFATTLMQGSINSKSSSNKAITDAYSMAFPTKESRKGTAVFPAEITLAADWLEELEGKLSTLQEKPVELIFGLKDDVVASKEIQDKWRSIFHTAPVQLLPEAGHFTQEDSPESFVFSLRRILKNIN